MKLCRMNCPSCGAKINVEKGTEILFCSYCGNKIYVDDEVERIEITQNINYQEIHTDESKIKENEIKEQIHSKELEYKEREEKRTYLAIFASFGFVFLMILFGLGIGMNKVEIPVDAKKFKGENYKQVIHQLKDIGFENVDSESIDDLVTGWITKDGEVEKVSINGDTEFEEGEIFPKDASVLVTYHTFKNDEV